MINKTTSFTVKFHILIQARLSSTRLPGKVLYNLGDIGLCSLQLMKYRLSLNKNLNHCCEIVVVTTHDRCDDAIVDLCEREGMQCFRGDKNDVLSRYHDAAKFNNATTIIRLTSDCPLIDSWEIERVLDLHLDNNLDYTSNTFEGSSITDGFDVEIFSMDALIRSHQDAQLPSEREHVTFYMQKKQNNFRVLLTDPQSNLPYLRLTLDTPEDLKAISNLLKQFPEIINQSMSSIEDIFYKNNFYLFNSGINKSEGWNKSFIKDKEYLLDSNNLRES